MCIFHFVKVAQHTGYDSLKMPKIPDTRGATPSVEYCCEKLAYY